MTTPPTYPSAADLVEATTSPRSFAALTTQAGDYLVVESILEADGLASQAAACPTLSAVTQNDTGAGAGADLRLYQWTFLDTVGGSRTVTLTNTGAATNYRARATVVRGSSGPGTGKATSKTGQSVSVARQGNNSGMFMACGDFVTSGTLGTPTWTPGGATVAAQDGAAADYAFGRWDDAGALATALHGIATPTLNTPTVAIMEMLGMPDPEIGIAQGVLRKVPRARRVRR